GFFYPGFKMKLPRRRFLHLAAGAAALPAVTRTAWAQSHPTRPLPIIIGFPGGRAAMSPFSQQLMYRGRKHEPFPLLLSFSHGDSELGVNDMNPGWSPTHERAATLAFDGQAASARLDARQTAKERRPSDNRTALNFVEEPIISGRLVRGSDTLLTPAIASPKSRVLLRSCGFSATFLRSTTSPCHSIPGSHVKLCSLLPFTPTLRLDFPRIASRSIQKSST